MTDCVFCKIVAGEIPAKKVYEDDEVLGFEDIAPQAPVHVLVIPKGAYVTYDDFAARASEAEIVDFHRVLARLCADLGVGAEAKGYRLITNAFGDGGQEVPHMHVHLLGGRPLGRMLQPA